MTKETKAAAPSGVDPSEPALKPKAPVAGTNDKLPEDLSDEDLALKNELLMLVQRLQETDASLHHSSLVSLSTLIRTSTSSMTSVPKPLRFLRPSFASLKEIYDAWTPSETRSLLADVISVLGMSYSEEGKRDALKYRLVGTPDHTVSWGHEYVRHLATEIEEEYAQRVETKVSVDDLVKLALEVVPFFLSHNAEADAVDLLLELEIVDEIIPFVDENTFARVCLYMMSCAHFLSPPDDDAVLRAAHKIYRKVGRFAEAMIVAIRIGDAEVIKSDFTVCEDRLLKMQLAYLLARQNISLYTDSSAPELQEIFFNAKLSERFITLGRELGISEPKSMDDVFKVHLETRTAALESSRQNLHTTLANAFVNAGFCVDLIMLPSESTWHTKMKESAQLSAIASLGLLLLWDVEGGLPKIDPYLYSSNEHVQAGALFAIGMLQSGVKDENDPALAILSEHVCQSEKKLTQLLSVAGLGIAYAGSEREVFYELMSPLIKEIDEPSCIAALSLGMIFVGSCHAELSSSILQILMEANPEEPPWSSVTGSGGQKRSPTSTTSTGSKNSASASASAAATEGAGINTAGSSSATTTATATASLTNNATATPTGGGLLAGVPNVKLHPKFRFMALGLALLYLGKQDMCEAILETLKAIGDAASPQMQGAVKMCQILVEICAYAGTGNVLKVQAMLQHCSEHHKDNCEWQGMAVLGVSLIAMGDDLGTDMTLRMLSHLLNYGEPIIRRNVPLAIALLCASNPQMGVMDTLSKYSHDTDHEVALRAIFAMGIMGAGTNNARLAQMLRQLASYYHKTMDCLFVVRVAQGLVHLGKGTITINPFHTNRTLMSRNAVAGLLTVLVSMTDSREIVNGRSHWMLYMLAPAMYPRFLITLDEDRKTKVVSARVGQAVDVVGQAGRPKTITGFQTHNTPVLLAHSDRAELATDEFVALSPVLEGFVIVKKNPEFMANVKE